MLKQCKLGAEFFEPMFTYVTKLTNRVYDFLFWDKDI